MVIFSNILSYYHSSNKAIKSFALCIVLLKDGLWNFGCRIVFNSALVLPLILEYPDINETIEFLW